jgi:hypothetical protein
MLVDWTAQLEEEMVYCGEALIQEDQCLVRIETSRAFCSYHHTTCSFKTFSQVSRYGNVVRERKEFRTRNQPHLHKKNAPLEFPKERRTKAKV